MRSVGVIGGLSPESTILYYRGLNQGVRQRLGGHHGARVIINSLDFGEIKALQDQGEWGKIGHILCVAGVELERAAADVIILASNTMHQKADDIAQALTTPFIHIADAAATAIKAKGIQKVGLLGTRFTMERSFYADRLAQSDLSVVTPDERRREEIDRIIYDELCYGEIKEVSRTVYLDAVAELHAQGAQGVILGCTEIGMLVRQNDFDIPCFDTTQIHIESVLDFIIEGHHERVFRNRR